MSLKKNMAHLLVYQVLTWGVSFLFLIVAPRKLGTEAMGAIGYAIAYVGFFTLVASLGTNAVITRDVARDKTLVSQLRLQRTAAQAGRVGRRAGDRHQHGLCDRQPR